MPKDSDSGSSSSKTFSIQREYLPLLSLKPYEKNPRIMRGERFENLKRSIQSDPLFFEARPCIVNMRSGREGVVICGNHRMKAAEALGWTEVPCILVDFNSEQETDWNIKDNNEWGEYDEDMLSENLYNHSVTGNPVDLLGFDSRTVDNLLTEGMLKTPYETTDSDKAFKVLQRVIKYQNTFIEKVCIECGISFKQRRCLAGICSDNCKEKRRKKFRPQTFKDCLNCGIKFGPVDNLSIKFCTRGCAYGFRHGKPSGKLGKTYPHLRRAKRFECLTCGKEGFGFGDSYKRKQIYCSHECYLKNRRVSQFEKKVGEILVQSGLPIESQHRIGEYLVDFIITGTKILIEADGTYWHNFENTKKRDMQKNEYFGLLGYNLFRVDEIDFYKRKILALESIIKAYELTTGKKAKLIENIPQLEKKEEVKAPVKRKKKELVHA